MQLTRGCRVGLTSVEGNRLPSESMEFWWQTREPAECLEQWLRLDWRMSSLTRIAASYIISSLAGWVDLVVGTLPGPLSGACTGHLLKVCGVGSPVRSGDFGRLASSSLKRDMFGQVLHLFLLLGSCWRCVNRGHGSVKVR